MEYADPLTAPLSPDEIQPKQYTTTVKNFTINLEDLLANSEEHFPKSLKVKIEEREITKEKPKGFLSVPREVWPPWTVKVAVSETSQVLLDWIKDCQSIVDKFHGNNVWRLQIKKCSVKSFIWIVMKNSEKERSFAFISTKTGDIHNPALYNEPFDEPTGNIIDKNTKLSIIGPYGVVTPWEWLPTHPDYTQHKR